MAGGAGAVLLVSLFLPWYDPGDVTGWQAFALIDLLLAVLAAAALALLPVTAWQRTPSVAIAYEALLTLAAMVGVLIVLLRVIDLPAGADQRSAGLWLALAAAAGLVAAGLVAMRDERRSGASSPTDSTGVPVAAPSEIQTLPAPPPDPASR